MQRVPRQSLWNEEEQQEADFKANCLIFVRNCKYNQ